ncbi:hypothetical protein HDU93_004244, partial [Gonapodya sp. JEL0774]
MPLPSSEAVLAQLGAVRAQKLGIAIAIVDGNDTRIVTAGTMSLGGPNVTSETIFEIGSITKTFTGNILAQMVLENRTTVNTAVQDLLPAGAVPGLSRNGSQVALWMLATHRAALPRWPPNISILDPIGLQYTVEQLLESLKGSPLTSTPPGPYLYSNYGFGILGYALTYNLTGGYSQALTDRIFAPLNMTDSVCTTNLTTAQLARYATGYNSAGIP